jgi:hypothetical protein
MTSNRMHVYTLWVMKHRWELFSREPEPTATKLKDVTCIKMDENTLGFHNNKVQGCITVRHIKEMDLLTHKTVPSPPRVTMRSTFVCNNFVSSSITIF